MSIVNMDKWVSGEVETFFIYSPAVDAGYYASLPPLTPGAYTLHYHGGSTPARTSLAIWSRT